MRDSFFVMERAAASRDSYCKRHGLTVRRGCGCFLNLRAVQYAHRNLDRSPRSQAVEILVDDDARVKLLDFGIAKLLGGAEPGADARRRSCAR